MSSFSDARAAAGLRERMDETAQAVEQRLAAILGDAPAKGEIARPQRLMAAMRHGALGGGKRLRPFLTIETSRLLGGDVQAALQAGAAVELVHCYSLVHDDLPAMDDDALRRGQPTVHKAYDEATAILAGDALLTLAFEVMAEESTHVSGEVRARLVALLARASGLGGMVGGQMLDLAAEGRFEDGARRMPDAGAIRRLQAMKTGALLAGAVEIGAVHAGADEAALAALRRYGLALGAAFQIADDILDIESTPERLGKATAKDAGRGKGTLVDLLGLEPARIERDRLVSEAADALAPFGPAAAILAETARFVAARQS